MKISIFCLSLLQTRVLAKWDKNNVSELESAVTNCYIKACIYGFFGSECGDCHEACVDENPREKNKVLKGCWKKCKKSICEGMRADDVESSQVFECKKTCRQAKKADDPLAAMAEIIKSFATGGNTYVSVTEDPGIDHNTESSNSLPLCGVRKSKRTRIVNGVQAKENEFPWQIHMRYPAKYNTRSYRGTGYCGGSILNANWVITAAHCIIEDGNYFEDLKDMWVAVGWHLDSGTGDDISDEDKARGVDFIPVKRMIPHEDYDSDEIFNDIALMELSRPIQFEQDTTELSDLAVRPICLPRPATSDLVELEQITQRNGNKCIVSGWGDTEGDKNVDADKLVYGQVPLIDMAVCDQILGAGNLAPDNTNICALHDGDNVDSCGGDSGGPLVCNHDGEDRYSLFGLTSWGFKCGRQYPGIYTRVTKFVDWIENTVGRKEFSTFQFI